MSANRSSKTKTLILPPAKIDPKHLGQNGKLISDEAVNGILERIKSGDIKFTENGDVRLAKRVLKKAGIATPYNVFVKKEGDDYRVFVAYTGGKKALGNGSFGSVKLMQEVQPGENSGKIWAVKHQNAVKPGQQKNQADEFTMLQGVGAGVALINYEPVSQAKRKRDSAIRSATIMELAPGVSLGALDVTNMTGDVTAKLTDIMIKSVDELDSVHAKGILHLDVKPLNFQYDASQNVLSVIDFGTSIKIPKGETSAISGLKGSPVYMAPEIRDIYNNMYHVDQITSPNFLRMDDNRMQVKYDAAVDVYGLGVSLAQKLDLTRYVEAGDEVKLAANMRAGYERVVKESDPKFADCQFFSEEKRKSILEFLQKMTADNPAQRPTLAEAKVFFMEVKKELEFTNKVVVLDLKEYLNCEEEKFDALNATVGAASKVVFVSSDDALNVATLLTSERWKDIKETCENEGKSLSTTIIYGKSPTLLAAEVGANERQKDETSLVVYATALPVDTNLKNIKTMIVDSDQNSKSIKKLTNTAFTESQLHIMRERSPSMHAGQSMFAKAAPVPERRPSISAPLEENKTTSKPSR